MSDDKNFGDGYEEIFDTNPAGTKKPAKTAKKPAAKKTGAKKTGAKAKKK